MKLEKSLLLLIAVVAIGIFVFPSTLSMFAGQHSWYDPDGGVPCEKCHFLEREELTAGGPHSPDYITIYNESANSTYQTGDYWAGSGSPLDNRCYGCHQASPTFDNDTQHAAVAVECIDCHGWVVTELTNENAAHRDFYNSFNASGSQYLQNANKACIGCHTHVGVNISWTRAEFVSYDVTVDAISGTYNVSWNTTDSLGTNTTQFNSTPGY